MGNVFETGVFAELVKKYSHEAVFYWRTKDKKEREEGSQLDIRQYIFKLYLNV